MINFKTKEGKTRGIRLESISSFEIITELPASESRDKWNEGFHDCICHVQLIGQSEVLELIVHRQCADYVLMQPVETIIPALPGFNILTALSCGHAMSDPVIAWRLNSDGEAATAMSAISQFNPADDEDEEHALQYPSGRVVAGHCSFTDIEAWLEIRRLAPDEDLSIVEKKAH